MIKIDRIGLEDICSSYTNYVCNQSRRKHNDYIDFFKDNIRRIVSCKPENLHYIIEEFNIKFPNFNTLPEGDREKVIFTKYMVNQYIKMLSTYGDILIKDLNVSVCPYCNRQYTFSIDSKKAIKPEFDHFFSKTRFPYLALSFYNLIPCCHTCNSAKSAASIKINPYIEGFDNNAIFYINRIDNCIFHQDDWDVLIQADDRCRTNIREFGLEELYKKHKDYAMEVAFRELANESAYLNELKSMFHTNGLSDSEIQRIILGNYIDYVDLDKRPLSKLTRDILKQLRESTNFY